MADAEKGIFHRSLWSDVLRFTEFKPQTGAHLDVVQLLSDKDKDDSKDLGFTQAVQKNFLFMLESGDGDTIYPPRDGVEYTIKSDPREVPPTPAECPEIDPNSSFSALALLIGAVIVLRGRRPI
jgi:hypothetical protein